MKSNKIICKDRINTKTIKTDQKKSHFEFEWESFLKLTVQRRTNFN